MAAPRCLSIGIGGRGYSITDLVRAVYPGIGKLHRQPHRAKPHHQHKPLLVPLPVEGRIGDPAVPGIAVLPIAEPVHDGLVTGVSEVPLFSG